MWIVVRLIFAAVGFVVRLWTPRWRAKPEGELDGTPYFLDLWEDKGRIKRFKIGMPLQSGIWLRLHPENRFDRLAKRLRLARECQTGDARFDQLAYVACDHPVAWAHLTGSAEARAAVVRAFDGGFRRISTDGRRLWLERETDHRPSSEDLATLAAVRAAWAPLERAQPGRLAHPFLWKALIVEGTIWGILGYAIGAFVESSVHDEDYHLHTEGVFGTGLLVALGLFVVLLALIVLWMRGSSRGHRLIVESAMVLALGLPTTGIQLAGDANRALDRGASTSVTRSIEQCEVREHQRKRTTTYSYHLWLAPSPERASGPTLPREIEVTQELCTAAAPGALVELEIGPGWLGHPWYRGIAIGGVRWSPP